MNESYSVGNCDAIDETVIYAMENPKRKRTEFGTRLLQARKELGVSQEALAKSVGITQATLGKAEYHAGGSRYTAQLAKVLGVKPQWLATGEGPRNADALPSLDLTGYMRSDLSPHGQELGALLDLIPDRITRAQAYNDATQAILEKLSASGVPAKEGQSEFVPAQIPRK